MFFSNEVPSQNSINNLNTFLNLKQENDDLILVTATEKLSQKFNLKILKDSGKSIHKSNINSFNAFINNSAKEYLNIEILDEISENELIIQSILESNILSNNNHQNYNYYTQIASIIRGLREDGIRVKNLNDDLIMRIEKEIFDNEKLDNLIILMGNYERLLFSNDKYDYPRAMEYLIEIIKSDESIVGKQFFFYGFVSFRHPDLEFLEVLSENNEIIISTNLDLVKGPFIGENNFFLNDLTKIGFKVYDDNCSEVDLKEFRNNIGFESSIEALAGYRVSNYNIHSYINIKEETYAITKLVKYLLLNKSLNLKPSDICVVSRDVGAYSGLIREFFADNKIPANISDRYELSKSPVTNALVNIIDVIVSNYSFDSIRNVLDSAYISSDIKNPKHFLYLAIKYRILGGIPKFNFDNFILQLESRLNNLANSNKESNRFNNNDKNYRNEIVNLTSTIENFKSLNNKFGVIDNEKDYSIGEFIELIKRLTSSFKIKDQILDLRERLKDVSLSFNDKLFFSERIEKDSRALFKFFEVLEKLNSLESNKGISYSLSEILLKLKGILSVTKYQIREKKGFGVDVTSIEQTRGLDYKVKIMAGAVEGMMPIVFQTDRLIGKIMIESEQRHYYDEFIQFFEFLNNDSEIYIFSHRENESELKINSHFISPLEVDKYSNINFDNSGLEWQNTYINRREKILNGEFKKFDERIDYILKRSEKFKNSEDLIIETGLTDYGIINDVIDGTYSASSIKSFQSYYYDYFYSKALGLTTYDDIEIYLTPMELGNTIHNSIEETFNIYIQSNQVCIKNELKSNDNNKSFKLIKFDLADKTSLLDLFKKTTNEKLEKYKSEHEFFNIEKNYLLGSGQFDGILIKWFESIIDSHISSNNYIMAIEYSFGNYSINNRGTIIHFNGKIDRVDISEDLKEITIIDYKLSNSDKDGLQLVIYAKIIQNLLFTDYNLETEVKSLVYNSFRYKPEDKNLIGVADLLSNKKDSTAKANEITAKYDKVESLVRQMYELDFSVVKKKSNTQKNKLPLKLLKRD